MEENTRQKIDKTPQAGNPEILNTHKRKVQNNNGHSRVDIPTEVEDELDMTPGDMVQIRVNEGQYGKYMELWIPAKQGDK